MAVGSLGPCFDCGEPAEHRHHVVPRSLGGTATTPLCADCHAKAHNLPAGSWGNHRELTREALERRKEQGMRAGGVPYGMRATEGGRLRLCPREWEAIQQIRALRDEGQSVRNITASLHDLGHQPRGNRWHPTTVARILKAHGI